MRHHHVAEWTNLFKQSFTNADSTIDTRLMKQQGQQAEEILCQIVLAVEFLAKQGLALRGHRDGKVDFASDDIDRGNFNTTLQLLLKDVPFLKHLP